MLPIHNGTPRAATERAIQRVHAKTLLISKNGILKKVPVTHREGKKKTKQNKYLKMTNLRLNIQ